MSRGITEGSRQTHEEFSVIRRGKSPPSPAPALQGTSRRCRLPPSAGAPPPQRPRLLAVGLAGYESGCAGYPLQCALAKIGVACKILPAQKVAKKRDDNVKTDKRDAALIARMLKHNEVKEIYIPTVEDESARDLLRCREDLKEDLKRGKQHLLKFLLRHDRKFTEGKSLWTLQHYRRLNKQYIKKVNYHRFYFGDLTRRHIISELLLLPAVFEFSVGVVTVIAVLSKNDVIQKMETQHIGSFCQHLGNLIIFF
ncbi:MAG: hypothetical protein Ta2G_09500 [Termitinemataceae bacterium]|nr:MAG: hypothetical protein Ta2G_09500 [Termitinemataceae bacterium]